MNRRALKALGALTLITALCAPAHSQDSGELGRLFFTRERRHQLDRLRELNIQEKQDTPADPTLTINGVVTRSSGKRTVWINGAAQNENEKPGGVTVSTPNRNEPGQVVVKAAALPAGKARVGETVNRNSGETSDLLGGGSINVRRAAPAAAGR